MLTTQTSSRKPHISVSILVFENDRLVNYHASSSLRDSGYKDVQQAIHNSPNAWKAKHKKAMNIRLVS